jgi:hypothetical protein
LENNGVRPFRPSTVLSLVLLTLLPGCTNQPGPPIPLRSFVLHDVQGWSGGQALWAADDRTAVVQVVAPAPEKSVLWEKRYKFKLTEEEWAEVERLAGAHHFLNLKVPARPIIPDETHPIIVVVTKDGTTAKVGKLGGDKHPGFDPLYKYLFSLCRRDSKIVHEAAFDWGWRPEGFPVPWDKE